MYHAWAGHDVKTLDYFPQNVNLLRVRAQPEQVTMAKFLDYFPKNVTPLRVRAQPELATGLSSTPEFMPSRKRQVAGVVRAGLLS